MFPDAKFLLATGAAFLVVTASAGCPLEGPLLPRPSHLATSAPVKAATRELTAALQSAVDGTINAGFDVANTSFSVGVVSFDSPTPIWEFHHRGSANVKGTQKVDRDSQYLIGSISKLVTDLLALRTDIDLDSKITDLLPKLKGKSEINWGSISLQDLGAHLGGIPPNAGFSEYYYLLPLLEGLGFPPLTEDDFPSCGVIALNEDCTQEQLLQNALGYHPVAPVGQRPIYSTISHSLLVFALSKATGLNYSQQLDEYVINPLGLTNTGISPGNTDRAVIPPIDNSWGSNYGDNAPGGGLYSSLADLSVIAQKTLDKSILSDPADVRRWLQTTSLTASPNSVIGMPWEIFRSENLTPAHPHTIDIYSKSGGAFGYTSQLSLIDQYGIGIVVLTTGSAAAQPILSDMMAAGILPSIEEETRKQAVKYTKPFKALDKTNVTVKLDLDLDSGTGLKIKTLSRNGTSLLDSLGVFWSVAMTQFGPLDPDIRLYPSEVSTLATIPNPSNPAEEIEVIKEEWLITYSTLPNEAATTGSELPGQGALRDWCSSWQLAGWINYGSEPIDRVLFLLDKDTKEVLGVDLPFLRTTLKPPKP